MAARGLDVDGITHVVNYDLPDDTESYVHRIGRTGRMGKKGESWSFVTKEDISAFRWDIVHMEYGDSFSRSTRTE